MPARRVLLIDDEDDIREVAQLCLEMVGNFDTTYKGQIATALGWAAQEAA